MESPLTYTEAQLEAYLQRIEYPSENGALQKVRENIEADGLATLSELQRRHLCAIPWGNSGLHYSQHHTISLHPETLFEKIVERRLDGYCMENTGLFFVVLRSLGYHVYATGGRVSRAAATGSDDGRYLSFGHMLLIVVIDGEKYMVDVGFGNNCATAPLPLQEGATATNIGTSEMRLVRDSLIEFSNKEQKVWIYQTRYNPTSVWVPNICFSDVEFLPQDFAMMNFSVSQKRTSWFGQVFVCMRMILDPSEKNIIGQYVMSGKEVKRRVHGQTEILQILHTEEGRVEALAKYFGMALRKSEIQGIQGLSSEIR
ncbi:hypothetical protein N7520_000812 [Penicillium odoratum]|uniref:uncharacterized protein n=1 Tax=Penicillium odoratum TaxID=1167516 RepID=UPI00254742A9|nr:uncharacterized protein N7520_000812 [Penicillium odoratum]KAJ5777566.1 hypothetical protein N7520_000812 [Penicillium odoratum]